MRIYNGKKSSLTIPLSDNQRLSIPPYSVSGDFMPNKDFLSLIVTSYDYDEIALIVSGPFEIAMCSQVSGCTGFVCQSLEEAIAKFPQKTDSPAKTEEPIKEETKDKEESTEDTPSETEDIPTEKKRRKVIRRKKSEE